jgi:hypothetical protein
MDKHNLPVKGAYLTSVDISGLVSSVQKKTYLSPNQKKVMECLVMLEVKRLQDQQSGPVSHDELRESAKGHGIANNRLWEALKSLTTKNLVVEMNDGYKSVPKPAEVPAE